MRRHPRLLTLVLLASALFLRGLVPAGWMPVSGHGLFAVEPCPAAGPMPMAMAPPAGSRDAAHHPGPAHNGEHDGDCAFAPLHIGAAPADHVPLPGPPAEVAAAAPAVPLATVFTSGPPALPPPATGPPELA